MTKLADRFTVLMTADTIGGVWGYSVELIEALSARGVAFVLATMGDPLSPSQRIRLARIEGVTLEESCFPLEWMENAWGEVARAGEWLLKLEKRYRPDLIHLNGYTHADLAFRAPVLVVAHSCVWSWWEAVHGCAPPEEWNTYRSNVERGLARATAVAAPTSALLRAMERHYDFDTPRYVIPNGRDAAAYQVRVKEPIVLVAGRLWDEAKNITALARASRYFEWPLCVAGDAGHRQLSLADDVVLLGRLPEEELSRWMGRAAIYALPAKYEPFGLSLLEAGLSGCALVAGDIDSLREVWGDAAIYVDPRDESRIAQAIRTLIENESLRQRLAMAARARASVYTPAAFASSYFDLYQSLTIAQEVAVQ